MKKAKMIGKKTLSVFLAVLMVLTAWVWVAPQKAEAATAGKYKIAFCIYDNGNGAAGITALTVKYKTKANNGSGTQSSEKTLSTSVSDAATYLKNGGNYYIVHVDNTDFPSYVYAASEVGSWEYPEFRIKVMVAKAGASDYAKGSTDTAWKEIADFEFHSKAFLGSNTGSASTTSFNNVPTASSVKYISGDTSITIPKTGEADKTSAYVFGVYDQYDVRMSFDPTYYVKTSAPTSASSGNSTIDGVSMTTSGVLTTQSKAQMTATDSKTIYIHAYYGTFYANKAITLKDPSYIFEYYKNTTDDATISPSANTSKQYYNTFGNADISGTRKGFTFVNFYTTPFKDSYEKALYSGTPLSSETRYTADTEWYAAWQANNHTLTFIYKNSDYEDVTYVVDKYYGQAYEMPNYPEIIEIKVGDITNFKYEFKGWKVGNSLVTPPSTIPDESVTYIADYTETVNYADLTALNDIIDDAEEIKGEQQYVNGGYTDETVSIFESALTTAKFAQDAGYLLSNQHIVDNATENLLNALNGLVPRKYVVVFVDEDGTILKNGYYFVDYGSKIKLLDDPEQDSDTDYHYDFESWDTTLSDSVDELDYVKSDLKYVAKFTAIPHVYTETVTPSTCTEDGVITKTCTCEYSYSVVNPDDLANHKWSTDYKEIIPATCATKGAEAKYCTACGAIDEGTKRDIAKLGHNWGAYTEYTPATCFGKGAEIAECSRCGGKDVKEIAKKTHAYGKAETIEKTCTTDGYTKEVCTFCGFTNIRDIDKATGHSISTSKVNSTCVSSGYIKEYCASCDYEKTTILPATGNHTYPEAWTKVSDSTCVGHGVEKRVCTVCNAATETRLTAFAAHTEPADWTTEKEAWCGLEGRKVKDCTVCGKELAAEAIPALSHNYGAYEEGSYDPTCTTAGAAAEKCSRCGDINKGVIDPLGHDWNAGETTAATCTSGAYKTYTCKRNGCGETRVEIINGSTALTHDFTGTETIIKAATCESDGHKTVKCKNCAATTTVIIPHNGHTWNAWTITKAATNTEKGSMTRTCSNNKCTETVEIPAGGHEWDNGTVTEPATCTKTGTMVYKCINSGHANCTATFECTVSVAQHKIAQKVTDATCIKTGTVEAYCEVCDVNCEKPFSTTETPVVPHTLNNGTAVDSTCTTSGYILYKCTVTDCEFSYKEYDATKPAKGHTYKSEVTNEPSCTTQGEKTFTCACGNSYTETIPAIAHTYTKDSETTATCTTLGTETYKCSCGDSYTIYVGTIDKSNHSWKGWETVKEATNDSDGYKINECTACGCKDIEIISATGSHIFSIKDSNASKAPTCTEDGYDVFKCSAHTGCTATSTVPVSKLGHNAVIEYTAPTCIATGNSKAVCETCTVTLSTVEIPATGIHDFSGAGVKTDATCTSDGVMTYTCKTENCKATKTETIPAKGHDLATTVNDATCGATGSVVTKCKNCSYSSTTELTAKGHIWKDTPESTVDATCEKDGSKTYKCENCNEINVVVIPKLGHIWDDWTVIPSTNNDKGSVSRKCLRDGCNATESVDIPEGGHILTETARTNSTCVTPGSVTYTCKVEHTNGACGISVVVALPLAQHTIVKESKEATCTTAGYSKTYCSVCKEVFNSVDIPVKAHNYVAQDAVDATCTTSGYTPYKCENCTSTYNMYDENQPATGHVKWNETSRKNATCTADGSVEYKCEKCDATKTEVLPKTGHNYTEDTSAATDATCTALATKTYKCSCGASYVKHEGTLAAHKFDTLVKTVPATNESLGYEERKCVCGLTEIKIIEATGTHVFDEKIENECIAPTCTENGTDVYKCTAHTDCGVKSSVLVPRLGHSVKAVYNAPTCTADGSSEAYCVTCTKTVATTKIPAIGHLYGEGKVTPATCKETGKIEYTCTRTDCTDKNKSVVIPVNEKAHQYATVVTHATCYAEGSVITKCSVCDKEITNEKLAKIEHTWNAGVENPKATCTTGGTMTYTCTVDKCGATKTEDIDALGHNWGGWVKVDATNDKDGSWTRTCENDANHTETVIIPKGNHQWDDGTVTKEASCTETGTKVYKCKTHTGDAACGVTITVILDKLQHELKTTKTEAKCEANGKVVTKCEHCDTTTITTIIPATGHSYTGKVTKEPTCTEEGVKTYTCAHDSKHTYTETINKLPHTFEIKEKVQATCTNKGYQTYKCATCTESYVKFIEGEVAGHNYKPIENTATCVKDGTLTLECETCKDRITADVPALGHDYVENAEKATTATCKAPATKTFECSRQGCNASYTISTGEKSKTHTYDENWTVVKDSTESSIGYKTRECTVCGQIEVATIEAKGEHQFTDGDLISSKVATCTENGYEIRKCSKHDDCGKEATITIEALGHTEETIEAVAATCEGTGSSIGIKCSVCDTVLDEPVILPALGHIWNNGEVTTQPTCQTTGVMTFKCTVNGCNGTKTTAIAKNSNAHVYSVTTTEATCTTPATTVYKCACGDEKTVVTNFTLGHKWETEKTVEIPATCTSTGIKSTHCADCSETKDEETIPALNHTEKTEKIEATCTTAGYSAEVCDVCKTLLSSVVITEAKGHIWNTDIKAATCTDCATETKICTVNGCGATETIITAKPNGHTWGNWTIVKGQDKKVRECTVDGCDATEECPIPTSGHNWNSGEEITAATCYKEGEMKYTCQGCEICTAAGTKATETIAIPKLAHAYIKVTTPATCETNGSAVVKCSVEECGYEAATVTLPKIGHTLVRNVDGDKAATCNDIGWYAYKCNNLNCTYTEKIEVEALGHNYSTAAVETEQPTCTENGSKKYMCSRCDAAIVTEIPALGHSFTETTVVAPTCTDKGYTINSCSNIGCSEKYVVADSFTKALGHSWSEWETVTPATNDAEGLKKHICKVENCGVVEYAPIPMLGHQWNDGEVTTAATCETAGEKKYTCIKENCSVCDGTPATYTETIPATGHKMKEEEVKGNCLVPSYLERTCENKCGHAYIIVTGEADGHDYKITAEEKATCEADGSISYECNDCHDKYVEIIPKLGHTYTTYEVKATCTTSGYTEYTCINDSKHTYKEFNSEPKDHSLGNWTVTLAPTDTKDGTKERSCSKCDYKETQVVPANIHNIVEIENVAATCKTEGHITYKCNLTHEGYAKACDYSYTVTLPVIAHSLTTEKSEPDCDDAGYIRTKCNNDGCDYKTEITTAALGHNWNDGVKTDSTCLEKGNILYTCQRCKGTKTVELQLAQHSMALNTEASKEATCTSRGYETYYCTVDGCSYGYSILGAEPTGHQNKKEETTPSTCKMSGLKKTICKDCNTILSVEVLPLAAHSYSSSVTAPTCTSMGYTTYICSVCNDTYKDDYKSVLPHDFNESIKDNVTIVEAKCETDGSKTVKCSACNAVNVTTIPATGHINTRVETVSSTCIKNGTEKVICACGKLVSEKTLPLAEHSYEVTFENGVYTYTCKVEGCGNSYTETDTSTFTVRFFAADKKTVIWSESVASGKGATAPEAPAKAADSSYHYSFSEWDRNYEEITSDLDVYPLYEKEAHYGGTATCTLAAVCDECGTSYGEADASKHVIDTKLTPATCEKDGVLEYYCTENGCTYSKTEVIKKTGHSLGAWETYQNGNCATPTIKIRKCRNNGCKYYEQKESYGSHTWYIQPEVAPTCTTVGYSEYKYCTTCGMEIDSVVIPKLNHRDNDGDGNCDYCTYTEPVLKCSCMCHSSGFMKFIYSIVRFFWIITKSQPACNCGAKHY